MKSDVPGIDCVELPGVWDMGAAGIATPADTVHSKDAFSSAASDAVTTGGGVLCAIGVYGLATPSGRGGWLSTVRPE